MPVTSVRTIAVVAATATLMLALVGCSSGPTQSKAAACKSLIASVETATTGLNSSISSLTTDPAASVKTLQKASTTFHAGMAKVTNPDIRKVGDAADKAVSAFSSAIAKSLESPASADTTKLSKASTAVSAAFVDIRKTCE
jgi:hypothetical protein